VITACVIRAMPTGGVAAQGTIEIHTRVSSQLRLYDQPRIAELLAAGVLFAG